MCVLSGRKCKPTRLRFQIQNPEFFRFNIIGVTVLELLVSSGMEGGRHPSRGG